MKGDKKYSWGYSEQPYRKTNTTMMEWILKDKVLWKGDQANWFIKVVQQVKLQSKLHI